MMGWSGVNLLQPGCEKLSVSDQSPSNNSVSFSSAVNYLQDGCLSLLLHLFIQ